MKKITNWFDFLLLSLLFCFSYVDLFSQILN